MLLFLALMCIPTALALGAMASGIPEPVAAGAAVALSVAAQLGLERLRPYRPAWNQHRLLGSDLACLALALLTSAVLDAGVRPALAALGARTLWPTGWPLPLQVALGLVLADLGHYGAHRALHQVPALWRFHRLHHAPDHLYSLNFFRMHPFDILFKTTANLAPLLLLGAPSEVVAAWTVISGVAAGSLNHANIALETGQLDGWLSTPALHRWHHSADPFEGTRNLGNVTMLFDRLFGTHYRPADREVAALGAPGAEPGLARALLAPLDPRGAWR